MTTLYVWFLRLIGLILSLIAVAIPVTGSFLSERGPDWMHDNFRGQNSGLNLGSALSLAMAATLLAAGSVASFIIAAEAAKEAKWREDEKERKDHNEVEITTKARILDQLMTGTIRLEVHLTQEPPCPESSPSESTSMASS